MKLQDYVMKYANRGACMCGKCFDAPENPEKHQPTGHTADVVFFKVSAKDGASKDQLHELIKSEYPELLDGREHGYMEIGAQLGDQGVALMLMGLGSVLRVWALMTPRTVIPEGVMSDQHIMDLAGMGYVTIKAES